MQADYARGQRLAVLLPFPMLLVLLAVNAVLMGDPEAIPFVFFRFIGIVQFLWIVPALLVVVLRRRFDYAKGLASAAGFIGAANALAWAICWWGALR